MILHIQFAAILSKRQVDYKTARRLPDHEAGEKRQCSNQDCLIGYELNPIPNDPGTHQHDTTPPHINATIPPCVAIQAIQPTGNKCPGAGVQRTMIGDEKNNQGF
jgi:hypothetical protein